MTDKENSKAIILCAHGSKDKQYKEDFLKLAKKVKKKFKSKSIFTCFVEINQPLMRDCIETIWLKYKNIYLFPLMFFDGYHMIKDIKQEVRYQKENRKVNIKLVERISLKDDLSSIFRKEVSKKIEKSKENILVISSSKSSNVNLKEELGGYLDQISSGLEIDKYFFLDQDSSKVNNLIKSKGCNLNIIIHPIFFLKVFYIK
jgi:sirohydrochlorin ferrochelatase